MSATPNQPHKRCVICGQDCAGRPRVKDNRGRYYCRECHEQARQAHEARAARNAAEAPVTPPADEGPGLLSELLDEIPALQPAVAAAACPSCGGVMTAGAVVCVGCGYNTQTGQKLGVKVQRGPSRSAAAVGGAVSTLLSPSVVALALLAFFVLFFLMARGSLAGGGVYMLAAGLFSLAMWLTVVILAFRENIGWGLGCLLCGLVGLYYAFAINENTHVKALYAVAIVANALMFLLDLPEEMRPRFR